MRYAQRNCLLNVYQCKSDDDDDDDFTSFGYVSQSGESFKVAVSEMGLNFDRNKEKYIDHLINLIFKETRKPCCWSFGRIFRQSGDIKLHGICLNADCDATIVVYTENSQKDLKILVYGYDCTVQHTKRKYVTGDSEKQKIESLLAVECAMVTRAKLSNEYIFDDNQYAAHLCSREALKQRKYRLNAKNYRHEISTIAVQIMKSEPRYTHTIGDIGLDPFYIFFGVPLQKQFLLDCIRRNKIELSMDSTGVNITPPAYSSVSHGSSGRKFKKCFLYLITRKLDQ